MVNNQIIKGKQLGDPEEENASGLPASFRNPIEDNVEYIKITGATYKFSFTDEIVTVPDLYFCKYPVTNKLYRKFLSYLESQNSELVKKLPREIYAENLLKFAESIEGYNEYLGKNHEGWLDRFQSIYNNDKSFKGDDQPVVGISWFAARSYCFWLSCLETFINQDRTTENIKEVAGIFRLPTENEWEWGAGGEPDGSLREYPWAKSKRKRVSKLANYGERVGTTTPVWRYPEGATPQGLMDMAGNVWEWMDTPYSYDPSRRVIRGGSWFNSYSHNLRLYKNSFLLPNLKFNDVGFRVVRSLFSLNGDPDTEPV